jgi:hypothetical protein
LGAVGEDQVGWHRKGVWASILFYYHTLDNICQFPLPTSIFRTCALTLEDRGTAFRSEELGIANC